MDCVINLTGFPIISQGEDRIGPVLQGILQHMAGAKANSQDDIVTRDFSFSVRAYNLYSICMDLRNHSFGQHLD